MPRANFNEAGLIRLLSGYGLADAVNVVDLKPSFAERLSRWLDWTDAIALSAALDAGGAVRPTHAQPATQSLASATAEEYRRVRAALIQSINDDDLFAQDKPGAKRSPLKEGATVETPADVLPFMRRHAAHQRAMAARIGPLRAWVRATLAGISPALGRLATIDAAMDGALAVRERQLLASVPSLLERHFKQLGQLHTLHALHTPHPQAPADPSPQEASCLAEFRRDLRAVLLAELDFRLLPVEGMIEAIRDEASNRR